jgi:hypothetical protein
VAAGVVLLAAASASGCQRGDDRVTISIKAEGVEPAAELDELRITLTASRTASGDELCEPFTIRLPIGPDDPNAITVPFRVAVHPGALFGKLLFVRLEGLFAQEVRWRDEQATSLAGGALTLEFRLAPDCLDVGTAPGEICHDGIVESSRYAAIFNDHQLVLDGERCVQ